MLNAEVKTVDTHNITLDKETRISEEEIKAIYAYLKTLPVIFNKVERYK